MPPTHLIVGLGNPGAEYAHTRHNIGFMAVDHLAAHYQCPAWKHKFKGLVTAPVASDISFLLLKPQTFMNLSGESVAEALRFHKLTPAQLIVFHDDLDLPAGHVKIKQGGGAGGHNGLKSIDAHIGKDYHRVRLGIGRPVDHDGDKDSAVTNYVLGDFSKADRGWLEPLLEDLVSGLDHLLAGKLDIYLKQIRVTCG